MTSRRKGSDVVDALPFASGPVVDADSTDEWMLSGAVTGDLSAKGKARPLIGRSRFVVSAVE